MTLFPRLRQFVHSSSLKYKDFNHTDLGALKGYASVVIMKTPEQLLSEGVQTGGDWEGDNSAPSRPGLRLRASLHQRVVISSEEAGWGAEGRALSPSRGL